MKRREFITLIGGGGGGMAARGAAGKARPPKDVSGKVQIFSER
jgi:hypothetical protein